MSGQRVELPPNVEHGDRTAFRIFKCRCDDCRRSERERKKRQRKRGRARKSGHVP